MNKKEFKSDIQLVITLKLTREYQDLFGYKLHVYKNDMCLRTPNDQSMFWSKNVNDIIERLCFPVERCYD